MRIIIILFLLHYCFSSGDLKCMLKKLSKIKHDDNNTENMDLKKIFKTNTNLVLNPIMNIMMINIVRRYNLFNDKDLANIKLVNENSGIELSPLHNQKAKQTEPDSNITLRTTCCSDALDHISNWEDESSKGQIINDISMIGNDKLKEKQKIIETKPKGNNELELSGHENEMITSSENSRKEIRKEIQKAIILPSQGNTSQSPTASCKNTQKSYTISQIKKTAKSTKSKNIKNNIKQKKKTTRKRKQNKPKKRKIKIRARKQFRQYTKNKRKKYIF